jgi:hypothetical protein
MRLPLVLVLLSLPSLAYAHGIDAGHGHAQLRDRTLVLEVAPAAALFADLDADGDGALDHAEIRAARDVLRARFVASVRVRDEEGRTPELVSFDVGVPTTLAAGAPAYVRFTVHLAWARSPAGVTIGTDWGRDRPISLDVVRVEALEPGRWRALGREESVRLPRDGSPSTLLAFVSSAVRGTAGGLR